MIARRRFWESVRRGPIVVVGSINMDLVCRTSRLPGPGETVLGEDFASIPGGKGANQAVAAARLGAEVHLVGRVGDDDFGRRLVHGLRRSGVDITWVKRTPRTPSGTALIVVDRKGENSIVVAPGANRRLVPQDILAAEGLLRRASVVLMQLEVPLPTVRRTIEICRRHGVPTILDPAPAPRGGLPRALQQVDILSPNEGEAEGILGAGSSRLHERERCARLLQCGPRVVVLKLGARGQ